MFQWLVLILVLLFILYAIDTARIQRESSDYIFQLYKEYEELEANSIEVQPLDVELDEDTANKLEEMAIETGLSIDYIVQAALVNYLLQEKGYNL